MSGAIALWPQPPLVDQQPLATTPALTPYLVPQDERPGASRRGGVIVVPGGGYHSVSFEKEGTQIAAWLNTLGLNAFVLNYRVKPHYYPAPQADLQRAIRLVKSRAAEFALDAGKVAALGFSAGGHLAASLAVAPHETYYALDPADAVDRESAALATAVLCYPVISSQPGVAHEGSFSQLCRGEAAWREKMSLEKRVDAKTPPCFLWHTNTDTAVPPANSILFSQALTANGVKNELHLYASGGHGLGLAAQGERAVCRAWTAAAARWLEDEMHL